MCISKFFVILLFNVNVPFFLKLSILKSNSCINFFDKTEKSIREFLSNSLIRTEYYESKSTEQFLEMVESKKDGLNNKTYYEKHPEHFGRFSNVENIYVEGFMFSLSTDFS